MKISIHEPTHNDHFRDFIEKHVRLAVDQFNARIDLIDVRIVKIHGGDETSCILNARLSPRGELHVEATDVDDRTAVTQASHKLTTLVAKWVDRGHKSRQIRHARDGQHDTLPTD